MISQPGVGLARSSRAGGARGRRSCAARGSRLHSRSSSWRREKTRPGEDEQAEEPELDERQLHVPPVRHDRAARHVDAHARDVDHLVVVPVARARRGRAAQQARTRLRNSLIENGFVM